MAIQNSVSNQALLTTSSPAFTAVSPGNLNLIGNTLSSTNTNGNVAIIPNGTVAGVIVGSTTSTLGGNTVLELIKVNAGSAIQAITTYDVNHGHSSQYLGCKSASATQGSFSPVINGEPLMQLQAFGDDGSAFSISSSIIFLCDGAVSTGIVPGKISFNTVNSSGINSNAIEINSAQIVTLSNPLPVGSGGTGSTGGAVLLAPAGVQTITNYDLVINGIRAGIGAGGGAQNTVFGNGALVANGSTSGMTAIGAGTLASNTSGVNNTAIGYRVLIGQTSGGNNTGVGAYSLAGASGITATSTGANNTAVGFQALQLLSSGQYNCIIGSFAGQSIQDANACCAIGYQSQSANVSGTDNTSIGNSSMASATGYYSVAVGAAALLSQTSANGNVALGYYAGAAVPGGSSVALLAGSNNTMVGFGAGVNSNAAAGTIAIGAYSVATIATGATSSDNGPGISIGDSTHPVGFRGDGTIYPSTSGAGFWRPVINGTAYCVPLYASGSTNTGAVLLAPSGAQTITGFGLTAPSFSPSSTSGIIGTTTNNSAAAGSVGELISSVVASGSAISLTTSTAANVTSISLTAGDWDLYGNVGFDGNTLTTVSSVQGWISTTSASLPTDGSTVSAIPFAGTPVIYTVSDVNFCVPGQPLSLASTTTVYLSAYSIFGVSTNTVYGRIYARRRR